MTTSGQIKCPRCGGSIGLTCVCRSVVLRGRVHGSGRFEGPIEISEKGPVEEPPQLLDREWPWVLLYASIALVCFAAIVAIIYVFAP